MTLEEKVGQLNQYSAGEATGPKAHRGAYTALVATGQIGSFLNVPDAPTVNAYQTIAVQESRLHIPLLFGFDVIHGFRTIVPVNLGLSASWDEPLIEATARLAASEASAQGIRWTFSPMVDIARDARWGRIAEGAGEDPYLGARIAQAYVRGYQGQRLSEPTSILACAKHFVAYGAAEGGRDYNTTEVSDRTLRQIYLPPFEAAARAGVATFMAAFNALNGVPASANPFTLGRILRQEWNFQGFVVSDWDSVQEVVAHGIARNEPDAAARALVAGVDMDMESGLFLAELPRLVRSGAVPIERVDEATRRVLRQKVELGLFDHPFAPGTATPAALPDEARGLARTAAEESFVLLKNETRAGAAVLPLATRPGLRIGLIGPLADSAEDMLGPWSARGRSEDVITLRAALSDRAKRDHMELLYAPGAEVMGTDEKGFPEAIAVAKRSEVVLVALGEKAQWTGEAASRAHLDLSGKQQKLLERLHATGKPIVLLLFNGRPLTIAWAADHVPAIVDAWFPGIEAGPALVRLLFGDLNPSGHLTVTFPRSVGQEPLYYNALSTGRPISEAQPSYRFTSRYIDEPTTPLYPFGHGLSYTTFVYGRTTVEAKHVSAAALRDGASLLVTAEVANQGPRDGTTVAQCYIRLTGTSVALPVRELKGFQRVQLASGAASRVRFQLGWDALSFWNIDMQRTVEPARLQIWISQDSTGGVPATVEIAK
jgi:beta-glucosidase